MQNATARQSDSLGVSLHFWAAANSCPTFQQSRGHRIYIVYSSVLAKPTDLFCSESHAANKTPCGTIMEALGFALSACCSLPQLVRNACSPAPVDPPLFCLHVLRRGSSCPLHMSGGRRGRGGGEVRRITHHHGGRVKARRCHHLKQLPSLGAVPNQQQAIQLIPASYPVPPSKSSTFWHPSHGAATSLTSCGKAYDLPLS